MTDFLEEDLDDDLTLSDVEKEMSPPVKGFEGLGFGLQPHLYGGYGYSSEDGIFGASGAEDDGESYDDDEDDYVEDGGGVDSSSSGGEDDDDDGAVYFLNDEANDDGGPSGYESGGGYLPTEDSKRSTANVVSRRKTSKKKSKDSKQIRRKKRALRKVIVVQKPGKAVQVILGPRKGKKEMRPFLLATFKRKETTSSTGFATRKVLLDTGARRSAITTEVCEILKLRPHGQREIKMGNGAAIIRPLVRVSVGVTAPDGTVSEVELEASVRKSDNPLNHSILGADWIFAARPKFMYPKKKKKRNRSKSPTRSKLDGKVRRRSKVKGSKNKKPPKPPKHR